MSSAPTMENVTALVVDNGSSTIKAGFGGEDAPRLEMPNVIGRPRHPGVTGVLLGNMKDNFIGEEAVRNRGLLAVSNPVQRGLIKDWLDMEEVWQHALLYGLQVSCEEHPLVISEAPDTAREDREKMAQTLFEVFNCPAVYIANQSALTLFATGRSTGMVVDSGASRTHIGPVWEGYGLPHFLRRIDFGGDDMTLFLREKLREQGYPFSTPADKEQVQSIKEELCYLSQDPRKELAYSKESKTIERLFRMPDGQEIYMNENRFLAPEVLFDPSPLQRPDFSLGIHKVIQESIQCCDPTIHSELYGSIVLGGGNTLFPKLDERVQREMSLLAPKGTLTKCVAFADRKYATWIGGSIVGSLSTFPCMWVSKTEYEDYGASIVHRKS